MRTVTKDEVSKALVKVILENPNREVRDCVYSDDNDDPVCVVGYVLHDLGLPRPRVCDGHGPLADADALINQDAFKSKSVQYFFTKHGVEFEPDALELLNNAQEIQDGRWSPGQSVLDRPGRSWKTILIELADIRF